MAQGAPKKIPRRSSFSCILDKDDSDNEDDAPPPPPKGGLGEALSQLAFNHDLDLEGVNCAPSQLSDSDSSTPAPSLQPPRPPPPPPSYAQASAPPEPSIPKEVFAATPKETAQGVAAQRNCPIPIATASVPNVPVADLLQGESRPVANAVPSGVPADNAVVHPPTYLIPTPANGLETPPPPLSGGKCEPVPLVNGSCEAVPMASSKCDAAPALEQRSIAPKPKAPPRSRASPRQPELLLVVPSQLHLGSASAAHRRHAANLKGKRRAKSGFPIRIRKLTNKVGAASSFVLPSPSSSPSCAVSRPECSAPFGDSLPSNNTAGEPTVVFVDPPPPPPPQALLSHPLNRWSTTSLASMASLVAWDDGDGSSSDQS